MSIKNVIAKLTRTLVSLFILFTILPVKLNFSSIVIISLTALSFLNIAFFYKKAIFKNSFKLFLISSPFFVYSLGFLNTLNIDSGLSFLLKNLSFIAFPFILTSLNEYIFKNKVILTFLISLVIIDVYLTYLFIYNFNFGAKFYMIVTTDIYHSTYLGMYNIVGYWFALKYAKGKKRNAFVFLACFFLLSAIMTSARIIFVLAILSAIISTFVFIESKKRRAFLICFYLLIGVLLLISIPSVSQKFYQFKQINQIRFDENNYQSISSRLGKIEAATNIIKENFWFGTGTGDLMDELIKEYKSMNFLMGYKYKYNPHNQYLENLARNGIIGGGFSLFIIFIYPLIIGVRDNNKMLSSFIISVMVISLTESILDVHKGITFYTFFVTILISYPPKKTQYFFNENNNKT